MTILARTLQSHLLLALLLTTRRDAIKEVHPANGGVDNLEDGVEDQVGLVAGCGIIVLVLGVPLIAHVGDVGLLLGGGLVLHLDATHDEVEVGALGQVLGRIDLVINLQHQGILDVLEFVLDDACHLVVVAVRIRLLQHVNHVRVDLELTQVGGVANQVLHLVVAIIEDRKESLILFANDGGHESHLRLVLEEFQRDGVDLLRSDGDTS